MKANKIWLVLLLILAAGLWSTSYTRNYIGSASKQSAGQPETVAAAPLTAKVPAAGGGLPESAAFGEEEAVPAEANAVQEQSFQAAAFEGTDKMAPGIDAATLSDVSDARSAGAPPARSGSAMPDEQSYQIRLAELDSQIAKNRRRSGEATANTLKAAAENERKLWETELERILDSLEQQFSPEEKEALFLEQKEWIRDRENTAVTASKKQSGSAIEEVEYNRSLAETTRARVYALAEQYEDVLAERD